MKQFVFLVAAMLTGCSAAYGSNFSPASDPPQSAGGDVARSAFGLTTNSSVPKSAVELAAAATSFESAERVRPATLSSCNNSTFCYGRENKGTGYALEGLALDSAGVYGETMSPSKSRQATAGVIGLDGSTDGGMNNVGVSGTSANGYGVEGNSSSNTGVAGYGYSTGVLGVGNADNSSSAGVVGVNLGSGYAADFVNPDGPAVSIVGETLARRTDQGWQQQRRCNQRAR